MPQLVSSNGFLPGRYRPLTVITEPGVFKPRVTTKPGYGGQERQVERAEEAGHRQGQEAESRTGGVTYASSTSAASAGLGLSLPISAGPGSGLRDTAKPYITGNRICRARTLPIHPPHPRDSARTAAEPGGRRSTWLVALASAGIASACRMLSTRPCDKRCDGLRTKP